MKKKTVLEALRNVQDFDNERNHIECLLLNLISDQEISEAFMDAEDKTQSGYRTRTVRSGDSEPQEVQVMQMISQIMRDDLPERDTQIPIVCAWFKAKYGAGE